MKTPTTAGAGSTPFGEGGFSITVTEPAGNSSRRIVTSTGSMPALDGTSVTRQVTEVLSVSSSHALGDSNRLAFVSMEDGRHAIELKGAGAIKGLLYAPNTGHLHFKDTPLIGAVAAKSIHLHGTAELMHDQLVLLDPPPELDLIMVPDGASIHALFQYAVVSNEDLKLHREFRITSAPAAGQVRIHANDDIRVNDTIFVDGIGFAVDEVEVDDDANPTFTGGTQTGVPPLAFPTVDLGVVDTLASSISVQSGDMVVNSGETVVLRGKYDGKVEVMAGGHVILDGLVYITGEFKMFAGACITGDGTMVGLKKIKLYGSREVTRLYWRHD